MVNSEARRLDATFRALANPVRRAIVARLARHDATVLEVAERFDVSLPAISRHLRLLEGARLIEREREGRHHRLRLRPTQLDAALGWIAEQRQFWEAQLDSLERYLLESRQLEGEAWPTTTKPPVSPSVAPSARAAKPSSPRGRNRRP